MPGKPICAIAIIAHATKRSIAVVKDISRSALAEALLSKEPPILFEALDKKYYDHGHLPTARMLPPSEVGSVVAATVASKQAPIVIYCASDTCQNSHEAAAQLAADGYADVAVYAGGKQDWSNAGLRLER
jgi:rhodanese-related sulfurtransferase